MYELLPDLIPAIQEATHHSDRVDNPAVELPAALPGDLRTSPSPAGDRELGPRRPGIISMR
jgi:hypothetical protein